ncbi:MAG TPA: DUF4062 domain-containing protein, partial [Pyrinomonadaceae bacterium]|nr:DUF4062 domain-containing protein [Pyrinomonadaceae bacterium]
MKIFLSAVSAEFKSSRNALASDLRAVGAEVRVQEDFQQHGSTLLEKLESYIAGCDRVIALVGNAYGWEPPTEALPADSPRRSYTQWEYFFAQGDRLDGKRERSKETFVYFASPDFLNQNPILQNDDVAQLQQKFIAQIHASGKDFNVFHSIDELRALVLRDGAYVQERKTASHHLLFYGDRIQNFLDEYLGTTNLVVPFGGRENELEILDNWLKDSKTPYALVAAEAGRGKSALLVRWMQSLRERKLARVIFIPISIRFNTALSSVTFPALAAGLSDVFGETAVWSDLSAEQWRNVCLGYMRRIPPDDIPLLVILDGLDEASDWQPGPDLFPVAPPRELRILVSARYLTGDADERGWLRRLGWESASLARSIPLPPLSRRGVDRVLSAMGDPLGQLPTDVDVAGEIFRLSQGDPLLVRLYVEALLPYGENAPSLRFIDLPSIGEGLEGYFERWWNDQERRAKSLGRPALTEKEDVLDFFNVLATALGPLFRGDLDAIVGRTFASGLRLRDIARQVDRFVIGDGLRRGYVFSHPRLGQFFWDQMSASEQAEWKDRFLKYGRRTLEGLERGHINPGGASYYIIQYYGAHLEQADVPANDLYALVTGGWLRAWEALEGTYAGFLNDAERAWLRAESALPPVAGEDMTALIKCALCRSSIATLSANVPAELLAFSVQYKVLTPLQALTIASQITSQNSRSKALSRLAPMLPADLMGEALAIARAIKEERDRAMALVALVPQLSEDLKTDATNEALATIRGIEYERDRATALISLAPHIPEDLHQDVVAVAEAIEDPEQKANALTALVSSVKGPVKPRVERLALVAARNIKYEQSRIDALIALASILSEDSKTEVIREAFTRSQDLPEWDYFSSPRAAALAKLAPHLSEILRAEALAAARAMGKKEAQVHALIGIVPYLPEVSKAGVVQEALELVQAIEDTEARANALIRFAPYLPDEGKIKLLRDALEAVLTIKDVERRPMALGSLAPHLPEQLLSDALAVARAEGDWARVEVLLGIAPRLPEKYLREALELALAIEHVGRRVDAVAGLLPYFPEPLKSQALRQAIEAAVAIEHESSQADALISLAPHLTEALLNEVLRATKVGSKRASVETLIRLVQYLPDQLKAEVTRQALSAARAI